MKKHAAKWLVPLVKYGFGFGLLAYVIYKYWGPQNGAPGIGQLLRGPIAFEWLAVAALLMVTAASLQIYRWYLLVRALDLPFTVRNAYRLSLVGIFYNTFIPGSVGGDLVKAYFIAHAHPERKTRAVASVIADRALGLFGLILFVAVLGSTAWALGDARIAANPDLQWIVKVMVGIASGSVVGFLVLGLLPASRVDRFAGRLKWVPKVGNSLAEMWYAVWEYRQRLKVVAVGVRCRPRRTSGWCSRSTPPRACSPRPTRRWNSRRCPNTWSSHRSGSSRRRCRSRRAGWAWPRASSRGCTSCPAARRRAASSPGFRSGWWNGSSP